MVTQHPRLALLVVGLAAGSTVVAVADPTAAEAVVALRTAVAAAVLTPVEVAAHTVVAAVTKSTTL